jgi:lipopolysaccharide/colanic/teichoic acid biosynthesis glycosyltransferase
MKVMTVHFNSISVPQAPALPKTEEGRKAKGLYRNLLKRSLDILLILITLPLTLPLVAVMALLVMRDGSSPFYWQDRVGRGGRIFRLMKIRTMVPDAKGMLDAHLAADADAREEWETTQKLKSDPRITRVGVLLRKTSLDELPQLWNVLKGDMSLVGPRPMMPEQRRLYPGSAYYALRPGITGPWQVSDRNEGTFAGRAKFDADYYKNLSFATDLSILLRTFAVVVRGTGY